MGDERVDVAQAVSNGDIEPQVRGGEAVTRTDDAEPVVEPRENVTVVATDSNTWLGDAQQGPRANAELIAFDTDGSVLYYEDDHTRYWDVDPVPGTEATVEFLYADHLSPSECGGESACTRNGIERVNLTTGESTDVYSRVTPGKHSTRWHDGDRVDGERYAVADIAEDRLFVANTTTGHVEWAWDAQTEFDPASSGGPYPEDWTHVNDVEVLPDGRFMASLRNHDQVVFVDPETGMDGEWTLGSDGDHGTLYEQHNPDYIPESAGGPAVVVADSENSRLVEYQRDDGEWNRTWSWADQRLQWGRDADRLPNGHTLVADSNGNRVFEVDRDGEIVWSADVAFPYEVERLGTGDESTGGPSAASADLESRTPGETAEGGSPGLLTSVWLTIRSTFAGPYLSAVFYVLPYWMGAAEALALLGFVLVGAAWVVTELYWAPYTVTVRSPVRLRSTGAEAMSVGAAEDGGGDGTDTDEPTTGGTNEGSAESGHEDVDGTDQEDT
nr:aryl-sulfate sulfotransferase [Haloarchaeobius salinus]